MRSNSAPALKCTHTHTHTHTDIHIILQQDDVWAEDGVCMKEGIWLIALIVLYRFVSRPPEKHHKCHKNSKSGVNKFVQKSRSHLKSLGTKRVIRSMFHTEDATVQNFVTQATWRPGIVHPCNKFTWDVQQRCEQWRRRGTRRAGSGPPPNPSNVRNTNTCCGFFRTGLRSWHKEVY